MGIEGCVGTFQLPSLGSLENTKATHSYKHTTQRHTATPTPLSDTQLQAHHSATHSYKHTTQRHTATSTPLSDIQLQAHHSATHSYKHTTQQHVSLNQQHRHTVTQTKGCDERLIEKTASTRQGIFTMHENVVNLEPGEEQYQERTMRENILKRTICENNIARELCKKYKF